MHFLFTNSGRFSLSAAFSWSNWEQYLGLIAWVFRKELVIEDSLPIPPYTQHHLLWMKTSLRWWWWWFISLASRSLPFHIVQYPLFIIALSQLVLKAERFHYVYIENCMQKYGQGFFCLIYVEPKHQSNEHNQAGANDFQCLIWIF